MTESADLKDLRENLRGLLPTLEAQPGWYGSIYFERKSTRTCMANLKQTQITDQASAGVVLRVYDGTTLFEEATDEVDLKALSARAKALVQRVGAGAAAGLRARPYTPPTWKERLSRSLDPELTSQLPPLSELTARTPVHFGIRLKRDPRMEATSQVFDRLKRLIGRLQAMGLECGLQASDLTYLMTRESLSTEESVFLDRETEMSQSLLRLALTVVTMSGADHTYLRTGGLGGLEAIEVTDRELREVVEDLKALKAAERLKPGRYPVIFGPTLSGVLAHEAFGHSQEGDTCARGRSKAWELHQSGTSVGNDQATILNSPAVYQNGDREYAAWGSYFFDEEGWLAEEQVLLDRGVLKAPMTNLTSALRLGIPRSANGKRENWSHGVYTRQTNTYFSAGEHTLDELLSKMGDGFLAMHAAGGMEDPKGMGIQVGISYLQEIRGGKKTGRVFKGPAGGDIQLTGYTPDVLNSIVAKSKIEADSAAPDRARHPFNDAGGCGKYHKEIVFAGCGGPYMLLSDVILG